MHRSYERLDAAEFGQSDLVDACQDLGRRLWSCRPPQWLGESHDKGTTVDSEKAIVAECACLGCEFGSHSVDEIRAGRCSRVTLDIEDALKTRRWVTIHAAPPDGRSLYLCDLCARQSP